MEEGEKMTEYLLKYKRGFVMFSENEEPQVQFVFFLLGFCTLGLFAFFLS